MGFLLSYPQGLLFDKTLHVHVEVDGQPKGDETEGEQTHVNLENIETQVVQEKRLLILSNTVFKPIQKLPDQQIQYRYDFVMEYSCFDRKMVGLSFDLVVYWSP